MLFRKSRSDSFILFCAVLFTLGLALGDGFKRMSPLTTKHLIGLVIPVGVAALYTWQEAARLAQSISGGYFWLGASGLFLFGVTFGLVLNWQESLPSTSVVVGLGAPLIAALLTSVALWTKIGRAGHSSDPAA